MRRQTILVIEDQQEARAEADALLEGCGFLVLSARSGKEGVEVFQQHADQILAVLVARTLFDMDGEEVLHKIVSYRPSARVIMTGPEVEEDIPEDLRKAGLAGYVSRPYEEEELLKILREVIA